MSIAQFPAAVGGGFDESKAINRDITKYNATASGTLTVLDIQGKSGVVDYFYIYVNGSFNAEIRITIDDVVVFYGRSGAASLQLYMLEYLKAGISDGAPDAKWLSLTAGLNSTSFSAIGLSEERVDGSTVTINTQVFERMYFSNSFKVELIRPSSVGGYADISIRTS